MLGEDTGICGHGHTSDILSSFRGHSVFCCETRFLSFTILVLFFLLYTSARMKVENSLYLKIAGIVKLVNETN